MTAESAAATWEATLGQLQLEVTRANFDTWLRDTHGLRFEDDVFVVGAPNDFAREWLSMRLKAMILRTLARVVGHKLEVAFEVLRAVDEPRTSLDAAPHGGTDAIPEQYRKRPRTTPSLNPLQTFKTFLFDAPDLVTDEPPSLHVPLELGQSVGRDWFALGCAQRLEPLHRMSQLRIEAPDPEPD